MYVCMYLLFYQPFSRRIPMPDWLQENLKTVNISNTLDHLVTNVWIGTIWYSSPVCLYEMNDYYESILVTRRRSTYHVALALWWLWELPLSNSWQERGDDSQRNKYIHTYIIDCVCQILLFPPADIGNLYYVGRPKGLLKYKFPGNFTREKSSVDTRWDFVVCKNVCMLLLLSYVVYVCMYIYVPKNESISFGSICTTLL